MSSSASIVKHDNTQCVSKSTHLAAPKEQKEENDRNELPLFVYMVRPGAPSNAWEQSEIDKNHEYSRKVHDEKIIK